MRKLYNTSYSNETVATAFETAVENYVVNETSHKMSRLTILRFISNVYQPNISLKNTFAKFKRGCLETVSYLVFLLITISFSNICLINVKYSSISKEIFSCTEKKMSVCDSATSITYCGHVLSSSYKFANNSGR